MPIDNPEPPGTDDTPGVVELRTYTLQPGRRDELITLFEREFVETQEAVGLRVLGTFRDRDDPHVFGWLRGMADMAARTQALQAFYGGPVWAAHAPAARATMVDTDDVHLLRPAWTGSGVKARPAPPASADGEGGGDAGVLEVVTVPLAEPAAPALLAQARGVLRPLLTAEGAQAQGWYVTEPAPNGFPRLPVHTGAPVLVAVVLWPAPSPAQPLAPRLQQAADGWRRGPAQQRWWLPTARSALRLTR